MGEDCDRTLVTALGGILVKQLMQSRANRHRINQQNQTYQQTANRCLAVSTQLSSGDQQSFGRLTVIDGKGNFFDYLEFL